jgi:hypothetical protein
LSSSRNNELYIRIEGVVEKGTDCIEETLRNGLTRKHRRLDWRRRG